MDYDVRAVKDLSASRWVEILSSIGGIGLDYLTGNHGPCPSCGGRDRWRFFDDETGGAICNQCLSDGGDGFKVLEWSLKKSFKECLELVAKFVGAKPTKTTRGSRKNREIDPAENLIFHEWNDELVTLWTWKKPPITVDAVRACGGRLATYRYDWQVIAFPIFAPNEEENLVDQFKVVGWCLYDLCGKYLPKYTKIKDANGKESVKTDWVKVKVTHGSQPGLIGDLSRLATSTTIWKLEGPSDVLAFLSLPNLPPDVAAITNANGAKERPLDWMISLFAGKLSYVCHDADKPGQDGATGWEDHQQRRRPGWANHIATVASECRNVLLPFPVTKDKGKDVRDFTQSGKTYEDFIRLANDSQIIDPKSIDMKLRAIEADDDPHRLARLNIDRYSKHGGTIRYWRQQWYTWKLSRPYYQKIEMSEFRARITHSIKDEFDRINIHKLNEKKDAEKDQASAIKVTNNIVTNVVNATASMTIFSDTIEPMTWVYPDGRRERRNIIALKNCLLDLDKVLANADEEECKLPHTPEWFSHICLPYDFDLNAKCPKWEAFLEKSLEQDPERIKQLQEWAGYCLLPDTSYQKFLLLTGEGSNGKSVFCAGLTAIIGEENCSSIGLEGFSDRFAKSTTLGKLVNICADINEVDRISEGQLKSFVSGDPMFFDRKGLNGITCSPTARLVLSCNTLPKFGDKSGAIFRRMLLIKWSVVISDAEKILGMDHASWWRDAGELPGMFVWALQGLIRLTNQKRFTLCEESRELIEEYRSDLNPARRFLLEYCAESTNESIKCDLTYDLYRHWCEKTGYHPTSDVWFGKEVRRVFPKTSRTKKGPRVSRWYEYEGIEFTVDSIFDKSTNEGLF